MSAVRPAPAARRATWRVLAAALVPAGVVCLVLWGQRVAPDPGAAGGTAGSTYAGSAETSMRDDGATSDVVVGRAAAARRPVRLAVPALGLDTPLVGLALQPDGTVEVPADPARAGWYRLGPTPGSVGSAVVLGHVDSVDGPAVFARLGELAGGDTIDVTRADGRTVRFAVRTVTTYENQDFPARRVYGSHGRRELNLVTCGGEYDAARGGYQANVVVHARRVSPR